ncbi:MAG: hypothetical protein M3Y57_18065 [Acidobacteriota bacterium]|nr:hypothetical protein [Acidobacteriota bacterium]
MGAPVLLIAMLLSGSVAFSRPAPSIDAEHLLQKITKSLYTGDGDASIARDVDNVTLTERFTGEEFRLLNREGIGPETSEALRRLIERSGSLPLPPEKVVDLQTPTDRDIRRIFRMMVEYAAGYVRGLVDFSCQLNTQKLSSKAGAKAKWKLIRTTVQTVRYRAGREIYESKRGREIPQGRGYGTPGEFNSSGEFSGVMSGVFSAATKTRFQWDHWEVVSGRKLAVFSFGVDAEYSRYEIETSERSDPMLRDRVFFPSYRGWVYADPNSGTVRRMLVRTMIPDKYTMRESTNILDYTDVEISGKTYPLLTYAITYMFNITGKSGTRVLLDKEFSNYRKFDADSRLIVGP